MGDQTVDYLKRFWNSGMPTTVSGQPVSVSGQPVTISGDHVFVESGTHVMISGQPVTISGDHVFVESGVYVIAQINVVISGVNVTVDISGDPVIISGQPVTISGDHVFVESGVHVVTTVASGQGTSGAHVIISGQPVNISGQAILPSYCIDIQGNIHNTRLLTDCSGILYTWISGQHVFQESGAFVTTQPGIQVSGLIDVEVLSGQIHILSGIMTVESGLHVVISGQPVTISGDHVFVESGTYVVVASGVGVTTAGEVDITTPTDLNICSGSNPMMVPNVATPLCSGTSISVIVKALSTNSGDIYVGGYNAGQRPFCTSGSEQGFLLNAGEGVNIDIDQRGKIQVCACNSGDKVCYISND